MRTFRRFLIVAGVLLVGGCGHFQGTGHDGLDHALGGAGLGALIGLGATGSPQTAVLGAGIGALAGPVLFQDRHYVPPPPPMWYYDVPPPRRIHYYRDYRRHSRYYHEPRHHRGHHYKPRYRYREYHYYRRWGN